MSSAAPDRHLRVVLFGPLAIFTALTLAVALLPALSAPRASSPGASAEVERGREVYVELGCIGCHTQQVRSVDTWREGRRVTIALPRDARFGDPTTEAEYASQDPPLLGTERTGPDLARVGDRMPSAAWHYAHLFDPAAVIPGSIMPSFAHLFDEEDTAAPREGIEVDVGGWKLHPSPDARALVRYLLSLRAPPTER